MSDLERRGIAADPSRRLALCSPSELRLFDAFLGRIELGRERYGRLDLDKDRRDFAKERHKELLDAMAYELMGELAEQDRQRAGAREQARADMVGESAGEGR